VPIEDVWKQIEKVRAQDGPEVLVHGDLLDAEWQLLSRPTTEKQDDDFRAVANGEVPEGYENLLDQVVGYRGYVRCRRWSASPASAHRSVGTSSRPTW